MNSICMYTHKHAYKLCICVYMYMLNSFKILQQNSAVNTTNIAILHMKETEENRDYLPRITSLLSSRAKI